MKKIIAILSNKNSICWGRSTEIKCCALNLISKDSVRIQILYDQHLAEVTNTFTLLTLFRIKCCDFYILTCALWLLGWAVTGAWALLPIPARHVVLGCFHHWLALWDLQFQWHILLFHRCITSRLRCTWVPYRVRAWWKYIYWLYASSIMMIIEACFIIVCMVKNSSVG